jgi:cytidylate kinase
MEHLSDVARYLDSAVYRLTEQRPRPDFGRSPFVTISRQVGADAHGLAEAVLGALARRDGPAFEGWEIVDGRLFRMIARDEKLKVSMRYLMDEEYHSRLTDYLEQTLGQWTPQDVVQAKIMRAVRALAGAGKVIIVGRAAALAAAELPGGVHVRLVASKERRLKRVMRRSSLDERRARRRMDELEESRRALVHAYFRRDVDDPLLYDAVFNEDRLPAGEIAEWIAAEVEKKALLLERAATRTRPEASA